MVLHTIGIDLGKTVFHLVGVKAHCAVTNKEGESSKKLSAAIERLTKLGLKVTNGTCKGKAIGFVGGVKASGGESCGRR